MASLTGRIPLVDFGEGLAECFEFILKHDPEHTKAIVISGFAQLQSTCQIPEVQIFDIDSIVLLGYRRTAFMAEVLPLVGNLLMKKLDFMVLLFVILGIILHARKLTLFLCKLLFRLTLELWIVSYITIAVNIEIVGRVIQSQGFSLCYSNRIYFFCKLKQYRNEVLSGFRLFIVADFIFHPLPGARCLLILISPTLGKWI